MFEFEVMSEGKMGMCQLSIKKLKATNVMVVSLALGGLTSSRRAQSAGTIYVRVGGGIGFDVGGVWAKGEMGMSQLPIKMFEATHVNCVSLALGGLTTCRRTQSAGTIHVQVGGDIGFVVGSLWLRERWECVS
jgi:hypothetical protein